jgi:hypothetical protein
VLLGVGLRLGGVVEVLDVTAAGAVAVVVGEVLALSGGVNQTLGLPGLLNQFQRMGIEGALADALPGAVALDLRGDTLGWQCCGACRDRLLRHVGGLFAGSELGTGVRDPRLRRRRLALLERPDSLVVAFDRAQQHVVLGRRDTATIRPRGGHRVRFGLLERGVGVLCLQTGELLAVTGHLPRLLGPGVSARATNPHPGKPRLLRPSGLDEMRRERLRLELGRNELLVRARRLLHLRGVVILQRVGDQALSLTVAREHLALQRRLGLLDLSEVLREVRAVGGGDALRHEVRRCGRTLPALVAQRLLGLLLDLMRVATGLQLRRRRVLSDSTLNVTRGGLDRLALLRGTTDLDLLVGDLGGLRGDVAAVLAADDTLGTGDLQRCALS